MIEYAVVIERSPNNYGALVPDLDGCVSTGKTLEEVKANIAEAIEMHIELMREHGETVPPPIVQVAVVQVASQPERLLPRRGRRTCVDSSCKADGSHQLLL
jgi:predicted RNase H-like HicB family nuclease